MTDYRKTVFHPTQALKDKAYIKSMKDYEDMYNSSIKDPSTFWAKIAEENFYWKEKWDNTLSYNFNIKKGKIFVKWFENAKTNICYNALDRHLPSIGDRIAYYWQGNEDHERKTITYKQLHEEVCKFGNVLRKLGVQKGDRVAIYMPMVLELAIVILACARIGAIHSVIFAGFSSGSLASRIIDSTCKVMITADGTIRGQKMINLKQVADEALQICKEEGVTIEKHIIFKKLGNEIQWNKDLDVWYHDLMKDASTDCPVEWMDAEDPLFMLYTSGSTGKPKGLVHTVGGYMVYAGITFKYVFDYHPDDIYFCTADIGWITGHSYVLYAPLLNGATSVMFDGIPTYPDPGRLWKIVDDYKVTLFYTAPTAIRSLISHGDSYVKKYNRSTLRILGTVGEPINANVWIWYYEVVGEKKCSVVDTYWQTETGGFVISPLPGCTPMKPGSATLPLFGIDAKLVDGEGKVLEGKVDSGYLVFSQPWPGIARTIYGDHERYEKSYFSTFPGYYLTGDGADRDEDGYYWLTGRIDDVLSISGHRIGTAEIESAIVSHSYVSESAVVPIPHDIKGQAIYAYITLKQGYEYSDKLKAEIIHHVRKVYGPIGTPEVIHWAPDLPKTRSGKIMRRVLRKIAERQEDSLGDISTMQDVTVVDVLIKLRGK